MNKALLAVMMQPPMLLEEEFNDWYDTEHLADRAASPGFESANRYDSVTGGPHAFLTLYDLRDIETLNTPEYKLVSGSNFTAWTKRLMRRIARFRLLAEQIYPGDATMQTTPFLTMVRMSGLPAEAASAVIAATKEFDAEPKISQARAFRETVDGTCNFVVVLGSYNRIEEELDLTRLGAAAAGIDFVRTFVPHRVGWTWEKSI